MDINVLLRNVCYIIIAYSIATFFKKLILLAVCNYYSIIVCQKSNKDLINYIQFVNGIFRPNGKTKMNCALKICLTLP